MIAQKSFEVYGVNIEFNHRVFNIHTQDDQIFDVICNYLSNEGFFDKCIELFDDDWGISHD